MTCPRRFGDMRLLALFALAFVFASGGAFAQSFTPDTTFPFLSMTKAQMDSLLTGFTFQWFLFKGYNGGAVPALYYVALASALVGALAIVFNKALHNFKTIAAWLLVTIICLFAPYNSQLLFYKINKPISPGMVAATPGATQSVPEVMGFTPQLVAAHVGTTLEVIFADLFRSQGYQGLIAAAEAERFLMSSPSISAGRNWYNLAKDFAQCGIPPLPKDLQPAAAATAPATTATAGATTSPAATGVDALVAPDSLPAFIANIKDFYAKTNAQDLSVFVPPMLMLYEDEESIPNKPEMYKQGLLEIRNMAIKSNGSPVTGVGNCDTCISYAKLIKDLKGQATLARVHARPDSLLYYLVTQSDLGSSGTSSSFKGLLKATLPRAQSKVQQAFEDPKSDVDAEGRTSLAGILRMASSPATVLGSMPAPSMVIPGRITDATFAQDTKYDLQSSRCSQASANQVYEGMFLGWNVPSALREYVNGSKPIPQLWDASMLQGGQVSAESINNFITYFNGKFFKENLDAKTSDIEKRRFLAESIYAIVLRNTAKQLQNEEMAKGVDALGLNEVKVLTEDTGFWGKGAIGSFIAAIGKMLTGLASIFAGIVAMAIIEIMRVIVDMVLLMVIMITPIAFLFGIAMPNHAAGLLIQSILIVGVLKVVPVTFLLVDRLGDVIYKAISLTGQGPIDSNFRQGVFLFGIAGIYSSLVGMTMFLIFKIGDAQNIQKLTEIDGAAEKIADAGKKAAITIASAVGAGVGGAGLSAWNRRKLGKQDTEAQRERDMEERDALEKQMRAAEEDMAYAANDMFDLQNEAEAENARLDQAQSDFEANADSIMAEAEDANAMYDLQTEAEEANRMFDMQTQAERENEAFDRLRKPRTDDDGDDGDGGPNTPKGPISPGSGPQGGGGGAGSVGQMDVQTLNVGSLGQQAPGQDGDAVTSATAQQAAVQQGQMEEATAGDVKAAGGVVADGKDNTKEAKTIYDKIVDGGQPKAKDIEASSKAVWKATGDMLEETAAKSIDDVRLEDMRKRHKELGERIKKNDYKPSLPGYWMTAASGFYGSITASGAAGSIPGFNVIKEVLNEGKEGPERARAWQEAGGFKKWKERKAAGQRLGFYEKEIGEIAKGDQYFGNMAMGQDAFRGMMNAARQAASEAAAKNADGYKALQQATGREGSKAFFSAEELRGATMMQAMQQYMNNRQMAITVQNGTMKVAGGEVKLTPAVMRELAGSKATKEVGGTFEGAFGDHYYLVEKDARKSYGTAARTRNDAYAVTKFMREDLGDDYKVGALNKMLSGKRQFYQMRGVADMFLQLRQADVDYKAELQAQLADTSLPVDVRNNAKVILKDYKKHSPLNVIHEAAFEEGINSVLQQSINAKYSMPHVQKTRKQIKVQAQNAYKRAAMFDKNRPAVEASLRNLLASAGVGINVLDQITDMVDDLTTHEQAALMSVGNYNQHVQLIIQMLDDKVDDSVKQGIANKIFASRGFNIS